MVRNLWTLENEYKDRIEPLPYYEDHMLDLTYKPEDHSWGPQNTNKLPALSGSLPVIPVPERQVEVGFP